MCRRGGFTNQETTLGLEVWGFELRLHIFQTLVVGSVSVEDFAQVVEQTPQTLG